MRSRYGYRLRAGLIPDSMSPALWEYFFPRMGIARRNLFDERADHRGRVSRGAAARDAI